MTWSYSGQPQTSDRDEVRALIQDTDETFPLISDEEIDWLLSRWMPVYDSTTMVAAISAALISRKFAGLVSVSAGGVQVDVATLSDRYTAMAADLRAEYGEMQETGEVDLTNMLADTSVDLSIAPLSFARGMHDNPAAGLQDFGGYLPLAWQVFPELGGA